MELKRRDTILVVDDVEMNRVLLSEVFRREFEIVEAEGGIQAKELIEAHAPRLAAVLLDIVMPDLDGIEVLRWAAEQRYTERIPFFLITAETASDTLKRGYDMGAVDVINKPFSPYFLRRRVNNAIDLFRKTEWLAMTVAEQQEEIARQLAELNRVNSAMIETLAMAIEFRDGESGEHVLRIRDITALLLAAPEMRGTLTDEQVSLIATASILHDVGKIAIPDAILQKPGKLTAEEFETMKLHTVRGSEMLALMPHAAEVESIYSYAQDICRHHHERWDGRGYPDGLVGDEISIAAQVVSLADVYDALTNARVYKPAFSHEVAMNMINEGQCGTFNPALLEAFNRVGPKLERGEHRRGVAGA